MKSFLKFDRTEDPDIIDPLEEDYDYIEEVVSLGAVARLDSSKKENIVKICIILSMVFHLGLMVGIPSLMGLVPDKRLLKPGEKVTNVRLIEQQPETKPEVAPPDTNAISDRNHVTKKEVIPKTIPAPQPPLGTVEPVEKKMASLMPPPTPEDLSASREEELKEEKPLKEEGPKPTHKPKAKKEKSKRHDTAAKSELKSSRKDIKNRKVDLRPNAQEIAKGISRPGGNPDFYPEGDIEEAVVDINTREDRFFSYLLHLKRKIQGVWIYPSVAAKAGIGGTLTVEFSIAKTGELLQVSLLDSSGHSILDESAMKAIRSAAPYFPFPPRMKAKKLRVRANFIYITQNYFRNIM